ncbi:hypothetical protein SAMN05443667_102319 [Flavobacterium gillisiae]|uniref:ABC-2 type transport system permease protein n=1 Tax=Flavobacterium gillisiae TaxID=150146 RepID=A0A1H3ZAE5_9FLAO|nr:DUF5687 family protein [Flavobacterium gillisiae]SEA20605.1 hypothetical protein SAMN05443667_102319 [Flavobacterium gillisiae]
MFKHFINLELKAFFRSASVGKSIGLKILMGFLVVYFLLVFLVLGIALYPMLEKVFPGQKPLTIVNSFVIFWLAFELVFRFFMQSLPVMNIKPLLVLPIKKESVIHFVLLKSLISIYNIFPLLVIIPFGVFNIIKGNDGTLNMIVWMFGMYILALIVNYANFLIKKKFAENIKAFLPFVVLGMVFFGLDYFGVFKITTLSGVVLDTLVLQPILVLVPILILAGFYFLNFKYLKNNFYLDNSLQSKVEEAKTSDLSWTKRFGEIAPFLQLDLKMIWRNKRPKTTIWISLIFLAYGLMIYTNPTYKDTPAFSVLVGILMTGVFMINYGQFVPSWDSNYYGMMMSQNIPMKQYLASKAGLMSVSVVILAILSTPYLYFGWNVLAINLACATYNLGVNIPVLLFAGSFNKKRIDLEKSPFMNYQGTGATQWIVGLPLMLIPTLIFYGIYKLINAEVAIIVIATIGVIGLVLRNYLLNTIAAGYTKRKYATINGFKQQEN